MQNKRYAAAMAGVATLSLLAACGGQNGDAGATSAPAAAGKTALMAAAVTSTFGVSQGSTSLTVDSGAGLVFKVSRTNGDITSIKYNGGVELQDQAKGSHISSGLSSTGTAVAYTVADGIIKITVTTSTLIQYFLVRQGENTVYMATYVTAEPSVGELRWITRLKAANFTSVPVESNNTNSTFDLESTDVRGYPDGHSTSKYYGNQRAMDLTLRGVTAPGLGAFMVYGNRESSSGGPFYRDIQNQSGTTDTEVYNYMNSGHAQTEANRMGLHGPYALVFTDGSTPAVPDMSWIEAQGLQGMVPASQRGKVAGRALYGFDLAHQWVVGFSNADAQYWTVAKAPNGNFTTPAMKPGTYAMTVYKDEYAVYTTQVTVAGGATNTLAPITLTGDPDKAAAVWRLGTWDGTPKEFLNGTSFNVRHPSDVRNAPWTATNFPVTNPASAFPAAQWKTGVNNPITVTFNLTADQVKSHTIRIGITTALNGGRPGIKVNSWSGTTPSPSSQPDSRSLTTGNYRGNNTMFTYAVPASAFVVGTNTLTISVASGSSGTTWLSPSYAFDALDML